VSHYVVNEGADNKLNSMGSVLVDIENVVIINWDTQCMPAVCKVK